MSSTRISRHVNAPRAIVYRALLDERAVATWMGWRMSLAKLAALVLAG
ncbi:MAG: hypothetical protein M3P26_13655 [Gemmatimonadota bacterium]|nr:hypothetical protein [Gemmatimonadota bacterium]